MGNNNNNNDRMSQSLTSADMFSSVTAGAAGAAGARAAASFEADKLDSRLFSPQFLSSGTNPLDSSVDSSVDSAAQWESRQYQIAQYQQHQTLQQQQQHQQQQQMLLPRMMQQSSQEGAVFQMTAMPLQSVGSIFKN